MLTSISSVRPAVSFRAEQTQAAQDILGRPGAFTRPEGTTDTADQFTGKKSNKGLKAVLLAIVLAAGTYLGLGFAAKSGRLKVVPEATGSMAKFKNFFASIGENAEKNVLNRFSKAGKDADKKAPSGEAPKTDASKGELPSGEAPKTDVPKTDASKGELPKSDAPKGDAPKSETPKINPENPPAPASEAGAK